MTFLRNALWILAATLIPATGLFSAPEKSTDPQDYRIGNPDSNVDVFIVTNWFCGHCQALEPSLQKFLPKILEKSQVTFVDLAFEGSENESLAKINLAFLINNKQDYLKIRPILEKIARSDATPEIIAAELKKNQIDVTPLDDATFTQLEDNFKKLLPKMEVSATPTIVVINRKTQEKKKLTGEQITEQKVMETINKI